MAVARVTCCTLRGEHSMVVAREQVVSKRGEHSMTR